MNKTAKITKSLLTGIAGVVALTALSVSANTVAHYRFEDGSAGAAASTAVDSSGNGYNLNAIGEPAYSDDIPTSFMFVTGQDNSLSVDFTSGNVAFASIDDEGLSNVQLDDFTIEAWVKRAGGVWQTIVGRDDRNNQNNDPHPLLRFQINGGGNFSFRATTRGAEGATVERELNTSFQVPIDEWAHLAVVADLQAQTLTAYADGQEVGQLSDFTGLWVPAGIQPRWTIGLGQWQANQNDWVNGLVDEVRISSVALEPIEFLNFDPGLFEIAVQPASRILWVGEDVTFATVVDSGGPYSTQWEISVDQGVTWTEIDGATSDSYSIESVDLSLDRNQYRAVVTRDDDPSMTLTTDAAVLRVGDGEVPEPQNVVAHYRFEDGAAGGTVTRGTDSSGNGHHLEGPVAGEPVFSTSVPSSRLSQTGEDNNLSMDVRGGNFAVQGEDGDSLSQIVWDDFTIEAWVNFTNVAGWQTIVGRDDRDNQNNDPHAMFYFQKADANFLRFTGFNASGNLLTIDSGFSFTANTWTHVAVVGDTAAGTVTLYANGAPVGSTGNFDGLMRPAAPTHWNIGRGQWDGNAGDWVNGMIDEVRFSSVALSPTEFLSAANAVLNFLINPADVTAMAGSEVQFSAIAGGGGIGEPDYQWQVSEDGGETWEDIPGGTGPTYTIGFVTVSLDGNQYRVVASRPDQEEISEVATLTVPGYPEPASPDGLGAGQLAFAGERYVLTVEATGVGNLSYEWARDGESLDETSNSLVLEVVEMGDAGVYSVTVTDDAAADEGFDPVSATFSTNLVVVRRPAAAISLNFVGASDAGGANPAWVSEPGVIDPNETAGVVPVANWNNSPGGRLATQTTPMALVDDLGESTSATATWASANTWGIRYGFGALADKDGDQRLFHGYIESRDNSTATITGIPYASYDVYVYPTGVEDPHAAAIRSITLEDAGGSETTLYGRNYGGTTFLPPIPFFLATATSLEEAEASTGTATVYRFANVSGQSFTITHSDEIGWNLGGIAAISIVNTTASAPSRPVLTSRPSDAFVPAGNTVTLSVSAESVNAGGSLSYQWQKDGVDISGATGATLTLNDTSSGDTGHYTVVVSETSNLGSSTNKATASVVVVDSQRPALISADMNWGLHDHMSGHASLRTDGLITVDPSQGAQNPFEIGEGDTQWKRMGEGLPVNTYNRFIDSEGMNLAGLTFSLSGATGIANVGAPAGGLDVPTEDYSGPLLRDYVFTQDDDVMTMTLSGLNAFAGREVTLVVYAVGQDAGMGNWFDVNNNPVPEDQNDVATVTLAAVNSPTGEAQSGATDQVEGRDLRFNNQAYVAFDAVVAANGTLTWTVGSVPEHPGRNAFAGFQLLVTDEGEAPPPPEGLADWREQFFGSPENAGDGANDADPDGDGFKNLVEYALGTDPTVAGAAHGALSLGRDGDFLTLTFNHIDDPNLVYVIEATNDLNGGWSEVFAFPTFTSSGTETYTDNVAVGSGDSRFIRLTIRLIE